MWDNIWRKFDESVAFTSIYFETLFSDPFNSWSSTRLELEDTALEIGIQLVRRTGEDKSRFSERPKESKSKKRKANRFSGYGVLGPGQTLSDSEDDSFPCTPKKIRALLHFQTPTGAFSKPSATGLLTPPSTDEYRIYKSGSQPRGHVCRKLFISEPNARELNYRWPLSGKASVPPIAFRFYDDKSQGMNTPDKFCAGAFLQTSERIPSPPDRASKTFKEATNIHLRRKEIPSPFVSVYDSLLPALHRGLLSENNPLIAIIDLHLVSKDQNQGIPSLYPAASITKQLKMRDVNIGSSEWLIHGKVEHVIKVFSIKDLREYMQKYPVINRTLRLEDIEMSRWAKDYQQRLHDTRLPLSYNSGMAIGNFLAFVGLPEKFVEAAALKIARTWEFDNYRTMQSVYLEGIFAGWCKSNNVSRSRPESRVTESPPRSRNPKFSRVQPTNNEDEFLAKRRHIESLCPRNRAS